MPRLPVSLRWLRSAVPKCSCRGAASRVAAPAIASETAGELTKGTAAEPYARVAGAMLGGPGAVAAMNKFEELNAASKRSAGRPERRRAQGCRASGLRLTQTWRPYKSSRKR